jgi:acyl-CoA thioester hydrolase
LSSSNVLPCYEARVLLPPLPANGGPKGASTSIIPIRVRFAETDLMGIVHHASYLLYFEEARVEYLARRGAVYHEWVARGMHFPVVDTRVRYLRAAKFYDLLEIETWLGEATRATVRFDYRARRGDEVIAEGWTLLACIDDARKPRRIPQEILDQMLGPERAGMASPG